MDKTERNTDNYENPKGCFPSVLNFVSPFSCSAPAKSTRSPSSRPFISQILASLFRSSLRWTFVSPCMLPYTLPPLFTSPQTHFLLNALFPFYLHLLSPFLYFQLSLRQISDPTAEPPHVWLLNNRLSCLFPQTLDHHCCQQHWILLESFNLQFNNVKEHQARKKGEKSCIWTCPICLSVMSLLCWYSLIMFLCSCPIFSS